ncbi:MAG: sulfite exporter TauE/SafE family protein [Anaerolineales bacterium]|nr:sulfite exporter TauE/SafE family protein [Anaerolineales bacterium]
MSIILYFLVFIIALLYASVGFGGATGYLAVMSLFGIEPQVMASAALVLNVIVASISFIIYFRAGHLRRDLLLPFIVTSIPAAFIGGSLKLADHIYSIILYIVLTFVAIRLLFFSKHGDDENATRNPALSEVEGTQHRTQNTPPFLIASLVGFIIGLLSGMVGIGGGIFLSPIILYARWGNSKQAATVSAAFIVLNSISGLLGRFIGGGFVFDTFSMSLIPFGVIGALAGSWIGAQRISNLNLRRALGAVMSFAVSNFWWTFWR